MDMHTTTFLNDYREASMKTYMMNAKVLALSVMLGFSGIASAATLVGEGATLPGIAYTGGIVSPTTLTPTSGVNSVFGAFAQATTNSVTYSQTGSGAGKTALNSNTGAFAATDSPLTQTNYTAFLGSAAVTTGNHIAPVQVPAIAGSIAIVFNNPDVAVGVTPNLSSVQIAKIFAGEFTNWNQLGLGLPSRAITVVARGSGSGTTFGFVNHLNAVGGLTGTKYFSVKELFSDAVATAQATGFTFTAATSNADVVTKVNATTGAIGYAEAANASGVRFTTVNGQHPVTGFTSPKTIAAANILTDNGITGVQTSGANIGRATYAALTGVPVGSTGYVKLIKPESYANPASGYPIQAISYLLGYRANNTNVNEVRNLLKVPSDTSYRTTTTTDPKYVSTVVGQGFAWLDGINTTFLNGIN